MSGNHRVTHDMQPFRKVGLLLSLTLVAVATLVLVQWRQHGLMALSVQSDSMRPLISAGDAVIVAKTEPTLIRVGDIVSYPDPDHPAVTVTHRVTDVDHYTGRLVTKGDANVTSDKATSILAVSGVVHHNMPKAGYLIDFLRSWPGLALCVYLPALLVVGLELRRLAHEYLVPTYQLRR